MPTGVQPWLVEHKWLNTWLHWTWARGCTWRHVSKEKWFDWIDLMSKKNIFRKPIRKSASEHNSTHKCIFVLKQTTEDNIAGVRFTRRVGCINSRHDSGPRHVILVTRACRTWLGNRRDCSLLVHHGTNGPQSLWLRNMFYKRGSEETNGEGHHHASCWNTLPSMRKQHKSAHQCYLCLNNQRNVRMKGVRFTRMVGCTNNRRDGDLQHVFPVTCA